MMKKIIVIVVSILVFLGCNLSTDSEKPQNNKTNEHIINEQIGTKADPKQIENEIDFNLPDGYNLYEKVKGDLNGDGIDDYAVIIKDTKQDKIIIDRYEKEVDRNRRGILIYLANSGEYDLLVQNLDCFSSENEDGGVYFPPELSVSIEKGKLYIHYSHGRYGYWKYTFRYSNTDLELIGYDASENFGPVVQRAISINFLTKKKLVKENINQDAESDGDEVFEETWSAIEIEELRQLSEIVDFDELYIGEKY